MFGYSICMYVCTFDSFVGRHGKKKEELDY